MIYVGSSWKNAQWLDVVHSNFRARGFQTWDFRENGFWWADVAPEFLKDPYAFVNAPESLEAFEYDKRGLDRCVAGFFVQPCGIATAIEAGYHAGQQKPVAVWGQPREPRLDIMWHLASHHYPPREFSLDEAITDFCGAVREFYEGGNER